MNTATARRQSPWDVYDYETDMLKETLRVCQTEAFKTLQHPIPNAVVESMLLHLRILVDILLSRGSDDDDIKLTDLLPSFQSPLIDELRNSYGNHKSVGSPCWTLNKMLAHPTLLRSGSYSYASTLITVLPLIVPLLDEISQARQVSC